MNQLLNQPVPSTLTGRVKSSVLSFLHTAGIPATRNDFRVHSLKNLHRGRRAFVIGNGPSLRVADLDRLKNEVTFASNKIFLAFDQTSWRPTYHFIEDENVLKGSADLLRGFRHQLFLSRLALQFMERLPTAIYYSINWKTDHRNPAFEYHPYGRTFAGFSVLYTCLQFAFFMGIETLYFLGVDQSYTPSGKVVTLAPAPEAINGGKGTPVYEAAGEVNHFHKDYYKPGELWFDPNLEFQQAGFESAKRVFASHRRSIYNATRGGQLEVFDRRDFDSLFSSHAKPGL
jgi:hypothetical protein